MYQRLNCQPSLQLNHAKRPQSFCSNQSDMDIFLVIGVSLNMTICFQLPFNGITGGVPRNPPNPWKSVTVRQPVALVRSAEVVQEFSLSGLISG